MNYKVDENGFFGKFGGAYVPEILYKCCTNCCVNWRDYLVIF